MAEAHFGAGNKIEKVHKSMFTESSGVVRFSPARPLQSVKKYS